MKKVVYIIRNTVNQKIYIGSAVRFNVRKNQHTHHLKIGTHHNPPLQAFVNKYGLDKIFFEILEKDCEDLIFREQFYIDKYKKDKILFNIRMIAESMIGTKRTHEQRCNISKGLINGPRYKKGYKRPKYVIDKMIKTRKENSGWVVSEQTKINHSKKMKGRKVKESVKKKISESMKGIEFSDSHKKNLSKSAKGNTNWKSINYKDPVRNKKISESMKKRMGKKVINTETGERYDSAKEAAKAYGMPESTFSKHLSGFNKKNKTPFIYED